MVPFYDILPSQILIEPQDVVIVEEVEVMSEERERERESDGQFGGK